MPKPSGKATISLKENAKNLPDIYFRELVQLYSRDCRTRGIEEVTIAGYEYACKKFLEYLREDIRCSDLRQELFDDHQMELATRVKAETVNSYLFKISPVLKFGKERGCITADIQLPHMACQEHFQDVYPEDKIRKLLACPKTNKFIEYRTWVIVRLSAVLNAAAHSRGRFTDQLLYRTKWSEKFLHYHVRSKSFHLVRALTVAFAIVALLQESLHKGIFHLLISAHHGILYSLVGAHNGIADLAGLQTADVLAVLGFFQEGVNESILHLLVGADHSVTDLAGLQFVFTHLLSPPVLCLN